MSCPYKHILGIPGEGVHARRIWGLAMNDILLTIAGAILTCILFRFPFWPTLIAWFVVGEILHYAFGVQTAFLTKIGITVGC